MLNRSDGRQRLIYKPADFRAFLGVLAEGLEGLVSPFGVSVGE